MRESWCYAPIMSEPAERPEESLLRMKFAGGRFDVGALPSSTLVELARLSRIFIAIAEDEWRQANPQRKRVPAGFARRLELGLAAVREGSAHPILVPQEDLVPAGTLPGLAVEDIPERAARRIEEAFISIVKQHKLPSDFPVKAVHDMQTVFSSFDVAEYPRFWDATEQQFDYTQSVRKEFLSAMEDLSVSAGRVSGRLYEINTNERKALMELVGGSSVPVRFNPQLAEDIKSAVSIDEDGLRVALDGTYTVRHGEISEVFDVTAVFAVGLPTTRAGQRLAELMGDDPLGEVNAISPEAAEAAAEILGRAAEQGATSPAIFPGEDGAVQLVWSNNGKRATIEIFGSDVISGRIFNRMERSRQTFRWGSLDEMAPSLPEFWGSSK